MADVTTESAPADQPPRSQDFAVAGRNAIKLGLSLVITWSVAFVVRFPLARSLGPDKFGIYSFADNYTAAFFAFLDLGIDTYTMQKIAVRPQHASDYFGGVLFVRFLASLAVTGIMAVSLIHGDPTKRNTVFVFAAAQFVTLMNASFAALLQASTKVDRLALANVGSKFLWGAGLIAALVLKVPLAALVVPLLFSELVKLAILMPAAFSATGLKLRIDVAVTKSVIVASVPFFLNSIAINIGGRLNVATLDFATGDNVEVGYFNATGQIAGLTMFLAPLLFWVLMPLLARAKERSEAEAYEITRRTQEGLLVLVIPFTVLLSLGADFWINLAYKHDYAPAALSLRVMSLDFILIYMGTTLSMLLITAGHGWSVTVISLISVPIRPLLVFFLAKPCLRWMGPGGAAFGAGLAEVVAMIYIVGAHYYAMGTRAVDRRLVTVGVKSITIAIVVGLMDHALVPRMHPLLRLAIDMTVYTALAFGSGAVHLADVARVIRTLISNRKAARAAGPGPGSGSGTSGPPSGGHRI